MPALPVPLFRHLAMALLAGIALVLAACGGGNDPTQAHVRMVNASGAYASLNLDVGGNRLASAVAYGGNGDYADTDSGTRDVTVSSVGSSTSLTSSSTSLGKGAYYTVLAYGNSGAFASVLLDDNQGAPASGKALVRVINSAADAGAVSVYLTGSSDSLAQSTAVQASASYGTLGVWQTISSGSWRLRVTAAGSTTDVRLDVDAIAFDDQSASTLVITPGKGGVLVNALVLRQQAGLANAANPQARVRVATGLNDGTAVSASVSGTSLLAGATGAALTDYVMVKAGDVSVAASAGSTAASLTATTLTGGADYTLLVYGNAGSPTAAVIADDNSRPSDASTARLRLVNGSLGTSLALRTGLVVKASGVAAGSASAYASADASSSASLQVTSADGALNTTLTGQTLAANSSYTVFTLGSSASPTVQLTRDR